MDVDWWHMATVVVLGLALACEVIGAYSAQKERLKDWRGRLFTPTRPEERPSGRVKSWSRLWLKAAPHERFPGVIDAVYRESVFDPESGSFMRGVGRLSVALLFLLRFAFHQPPPFLS